ncbi:MAG: hypothetical protein CMM73_03555 [Rhodospirillaceae bacterium]|nr:hypothetical protein [Rhodospirillaceae bacterium]
MKVERKVRKKLWEFPHNFQCSIIGTCLTLAEARKVGRKFGVISDDPTQLDTTVHSFIVREASKQSIVSTHVCNLLNRKFEGMIRKASAADTPPKVMAFWREACNSGLVPSGYWAALTCPALDEDGMIRIFSDVHMLSHINGSNNVVLMRRLAHTEKALEENLEKQSELQRRSIMREKDLRKKIEIETTKTKFARQQLEGRVESQCPDHREMTKSLEGKLDKLQLQTNKLSHQLCERNHELAAARNILKVRDEEIADLRRLLESQDRRFHTNIVPAAPDVQPVINGMQLLYVGGRPQTKIRIQNLVQEQGAELVCHDGGKTKTSICALKTLIESSHAVFMPVDKVSHASAIETKRLCRQCNKPFITMKSCSMACFQQALLQLQAYKNNDAKSAEHTATE